MINFIASSAPLDLAGIGEQIAIGLIIGAQAAIPIFCAWYAIRFIARAFKDVQ